MKKATREELVTLANAMEQAKREEAAERAKAMMEAGTVLRTKREAAKMTLRAMAEALDVSPPFLSDVEHGRRRLSVEQAAKADAALSKVVPQAEEGEAVSAASAVFDAVKP